MISLKWIHKTIEYFAVISSTFYLGYIRIISCHDIASAAVSVWDKDQCMDRTQTIYSCWAVYYRFIACYLFYTFYSTVALILFYGLLCCMRLWPMFAYACVGYNKLRFLHVLSRFMLCWYTSHDAMRVTSEYDTNEVTFTPAESCSDAERKIKLKRATGKKLTMQ